MQRAPRLTAVALLVGFYVLCLAVLGAAAGLTFLAWAYADWAAVKVTIVALAIAWPVARSVLATLPDDKPEGVQVDRHDQPRLWAEVDALAATLETPPPDEMWLVMEPNAAVSERSRMLGLVGGRRRLQVGLPLAACMSEEEFRAVLAHELGHLGAGHTRSGRIAYRGLSSVWAAAGRLEGTITGIPFIAYAKLYARVAMGSSRRDELDADRAAAEVSGAAVLAAALERLGPIGAAWMLLLESYIELGSDASLVPADPIGGLRALLGEPRRAELLRRVAAAEAEPSPFDSHPPIRARLEALDVVPRTSEAVVLGVPATGALDALVADPDRTLAAARDRWYSHTITAAGLDPTAFGVASWDEIAKKSLPTLSERARAAVVTSARDVAAAAAPAGSPTTLQGLELVMELLAQGRGTALAARLVETPEKVLTEDATVRDEALELCADAVYLALADSAVRANGGEWRISWADIVLAVAGDGTVLDLRPSVREAVGDPAAAVNLHAMLDGFGIDLHDSDIVLPVPREAPADERIADRRPPALGAIPIVKLRKRIYDMVVFRDACVLVPLPFWRKFRHEFVRQLGISRPMQRRLDALSARSYADLEAVAGVEVIRVRDVLSARAGTGLSGTKLTLTMVDGTSVQLGLALASQELAEDVARQTFGAVRVLQP